ncbi:hypothetical protein [Tsuneonella amylolytica]|uniref:hypothetical protein n=1 Tax=Tsuneonella amylolytica TaxID=2338327 RepID=UPI000EA8D5FB|nr:hypothetical protein [Tsuneonella amylolytica]
MMTATDMSPRSTRILRIAGWTVAACLLALPAIAMLAGVEGVSWTASDFVFAATIFAIVGGVFELAARASANLAFRLGTGLAVACAFLQIWINLAVGIIGSEDNPANWTYFAVVFAAIVGAVAALGKVRVLAPAMVAVAGLQVLFSILHAVNGTPTPIIDAFFAAMWLGAAALFRRAAREQIAA